MADNEATFHFGQLVERKTTRHKANPEKRRRKRWLRKNPQGSVGRFAWEQKHALNDRLRQLLNSED